MQHSSSSDNANNHFCLSVSFLLLECQPRSCRFIIPSLIMSSTNLQLVTFNATSSQHKQICQKCLNKKAKGTNFYTLGYNSKIWLDLPTRKYGLLTKVRNKMLYNVQWNFPITAILLGCYESFGKMANCLPERKEGEKRKVLSAFSKSHRSWMCCRIWEQTLCRSFH